MGIFSKLFGSDPLREVEKQLEDLYVPMFQSMMGMSSSEAKSSFRDMFNQATEEDHWKKMVCLKKKLQKNLEKRIRFMVIPKILRMRQEKIDHYILNLRIG